MGTLLEKIKERRNENLQLRKEQKEARVKMNTAALKQARKIYSQEYIKGAKEAVKARAAHEAMERFGYTKAQKRQRTMKNITKELEGLGNWAAGSNQPTKKGKKGKTIKAKKTNPFDMGDLDDLMW